MSVERVTEIMKIAQEPWVPNVEREEVGQWGLEYLRMETARKLNVPLTSITAEFQKDPELIAKIGLNDTAGLGEAFTVFSRLQNTIVAERGLAACSSQPALSAEIRSGISSYCPSEEGKYNHQVLYWQDKVQGKIENYEVPSFAYTDNLGKLLAVTSQISVVSNRPSDGFLRPDKKTLQTSTGVADPNALNSLMALADLRADAFERTLTGSLKTVLETRFSFGSSPMSEGELQIAAAKGAKQMCPSCPETVLKKVAEAAKGAVWTKETNEQRQGRSLYLGPEKALRGICDRLFAARDARGNRFYFGHPVSRVSASNLTPLNLMVGPGSVEMSNAWESRKEILKTVIGGGREGVLLLTNALTQYQPEPGVANAEISKSQIDPGNVNFTCRDPLDPVDVAKVKLAVEEASGYATEFGKKTFENLSASKFDHESMLKDLKQLMKTSPRAVGESLSRSGSLAPYVCEALHSIDSDDARDRMENRLLIWGSVVVGTALTATGVLAPAGTALCASAIIGGAALGAATGAYDLVRARRSEIQAELYRDAAFAQGGNLARLQVSNEQLDLYAEQKFSAILNLGLSAFDAGTFAFKKVFPSKVFSPGVSRGAGAFGGTGVEMDVYGKLDNAGIFPESLRGMWKDNLPAFRSALEHGLDPTSAASRELYGIIEKSSTGPQLKAAVAAWAKKHNLPYRPVFTDDLKAEVESLKAKGLVPKDLPEDFIQEGNNFIDAKTYNYLIKNKVIPIADPHDLLSHLSILEDARYVRAHDEFSNLDNQIAEFSNRIDSKAYKRNPAISDKELGPTDYQSTSFRSSDKRSQLSRQLDRWQLLGPGRLGSLEDFAYVKDAADGARLIIHGNAGMNGFRELQNLKFNSFLEFFLGIRRENSVMSVSMLKVFPRKFLTDPENAAAIARMRRAGEGIGMDVWNEGAALASPRAKLYKKTVALAKAQKPTAELTSPQMENVIAGLTDFIAKDPELAKIFSYQSRMEVLEAHNALTETYLNWLEKNRIYVPAK